MTQPLKLARAAALGLCALLSSWVALGQDALHPQKIPDPNPAAASLQDTQATQLERGANSLTADQLIRVLRSNPEILIEAKALLADDVQDESDPTAQTGNPTDEQLFLSVEQDPDTRARLSDFLLARGYIDQQNPQLQSSAPPQGRSMPALDDSAVPDQSPFAEDDSPGQVRARNKVGTAPPVGSKPASQPTAQRPQPPMNESPNITDDPAVLRRPAPYNLRSLRDLYAQLPEMPEHLKRFGSDVFTNRTASPVELMDVPIGPDYVLGSGDELSIAIWGGVSQNLVRTVDREGRVVLPEAGPVAVAGLSLGRAEELVRQQLQPQFRNAQVSLTIARLRTIEIFIAGDAQRPGAYQVSALASPLSALLAAGGPTARGSLRILRHMRGDQLVHEIDLYDFLLRGVRAQERMLSGDTLLVPPVGAQVAVFGAVKRPAIYELNGERTLDAVLSSAGGLTVAAELSRITVERLVANLRREEIGVGHSSDTPDALRVRLAQFEVRDGDRVRVGAVLPSSDRVIYLQGHVARPGKVGFQDGMQVSDVLRSYRDALPEPAQIAEIVRLVPPDLHPETIEFNLADVLVGNASVPLQAFDTIRLFGRYETDAPMVMVRGEVKRPGAYPLFDGMTAAQLVLAAGGFKRDALVESADLVSYGSVNGTRISIERRDVAIGAALLRHDSAADSALKPGDVLTIHQITGWNDIGASIQLLGEVAHPGSYGFTEGEHLSDVLRRAGGMRPDGYPEGAVLTRPEVAMLEERNREELIRQIQASAAAARLSRVAASSEQTASLQLVQEQQAQVLAELRNQTATGRMVIHIDAQIDAWAGTPADIEVRSGDVLRIPKRPGFVLVSGQVYNASAIAFLPGKSAGWYLQCAGGATSIANRKEIFVIRANGSVVGRRSSSWYEHDVLSTQLNAGDTIVVPQKIVGSSVTWRNLLATAQVVASLSIAATVAGL